MSFTRMIRPEPITLLVEALDNDSSKNPNLSSEAPLSCEDPSSCEKGVFIGEETLNYYMLGT